MYFLYDLLVRIAGFILRVPALYKPKIRLFLQGRKAVWEYLDNTIEADKPVIWMHTASLGEFEQGLPVLEHLQATMTGHQLLVTFFSPSGYEVKKGRLPGVAMCYLPLDTAANARKFIRAARPTMALFVKYEVWPNYFRELERRNVPILMFSALFRKEQAYFKWYGGLLRKSLLKAERIYVQDAVSLELLARIGFTRSEKAGDTRLDRVFQIAKQDNHLDFMERFVAGRTCLVAGSTWAEDEDILIPFLNESLPEDACVVIAPHETGEACVSNLVRRLRSKTIRYSQLGEQDPSGAAVMIVDTIGLLTRIYSYAAIAYVGGGSGPACTTPWNLLFSAFPS